MLSRSKLAAAAVVVGVGGLLAAGRWLQPRLDGALGPAPSISRPPVTAVPTTSGPPVATATTAIVAPLPGVTRIATFTSQVDAIAVGRGVVWVASGGLVARVDPATRRAEVVPGLDATAPPVVGLTVGAGAVWADTTGSRLLRIDPRTARVVASLAVPAADVAIGDNAVWVVCCDVGGAGVLRRIDPASNRVVATVRLPGAADAVGVGAGAVWVRSPAGLVWRVDPASGRVVATIRLRHDAGSGEPGGAVAVTRDGVWVSDRAGGRVWRIDPRRNQLTGERWQAEGRDLAVAADGVVWTSSQTRLLGFGRSKEVGTYQMLFEFAELITAVAAGPDGLWLGTGDGLFHVDQDALQGP
jgi:virginiamycin B lyase